MELMRALDPSLRISNLGEWPPIRRPEHLAQFAKGLWCGLAD